MNLLFSMPNTADQKQSVQFASTLRSELIVKLANERLVPLFSGAKAIEITPSTEKHKLVATCGPSKIRFKIEQQDTVAYTIKRQQNFGKVSDPGVNEPKIIQAFVDITKEMRAPLSECYDDIQEAFSIRMIAASLSANNKPTRDTIITLIRHLDRWSRGTYEGRQHSAAIGIISKEQHSGIGVAPVCTGHPANDRR